MLVYSDFGSITNMTYKEVAAIICGQYVFSASVFLASLNPKDLKATIWLI